MPPVEDDVTALPSHLLDAVKMYRDALPADLLQQVRREAAAIEQSPNYWTSAKKIKDDGSPDAELCTVEAVARVLYSRMQDDLPSSWSGVEWWCQLYEPGKGLAFHFDKDEEQMVATGEMRHPLFSSIVYFHSEEDDFDGRSSIRLGPTVITKQVYNNEHKATIPESPDESVLVYPLANSFCVFRGDLAHGVLDSCSSKRRKSLIINWWGCSVGGTPDGLLAVKEISSEEIMEKEMKLWPKALLDDALETVDHKKEESCRLVISCSDLPMDGAQYPCLLADQVFKDRNVSLAEHSVVSVTHKGLMLCPIEGEDIGTLAAFVNADFEVEEEGD